MQYVTSGLELLGIVLVITAAGLAVGDHFGLPAGLAAAAMVAWLASWVLQGAPLPRPRRSGS